MDLDDVDRGILYLLQSDARRLTTKEMAEHVGVSASTVRNRIDRMETGGVIRGYRPVIDYAEAGASLHVRVACSAPPADRERLASDALDVDGVTVVRRLLDGRANVVVEAVGPDSAAVADVVDRLAATGLGVVETNVIADTTVQPYAGFGAELAGGQ